MWPVLSRVVSWRGFSISRKTIHKKGSKRAVTVKAPANELRLERVPKRFEDYAPHTQLNVAGSFIPFTCIAMSEAEEISAAQCDRLAGEFAEITNANSAEAIMYLQQEDWKLDRALEAYYSSVAAGSGAGSSVSPVDGQHVKLSGKQSQTISLDVSQEGEISAKECDKLAGEFAEITNTNSAEAIMYLQQEDWKLDRALEAYYNSAAANSAPSTSAAGSSKLVSSDCGSSGSTSEVKGQEVQNAGKALGTVAVPNQALNDPHKIKLLSWNLDGLDDVSLISRTKAAIAEFRKENPDIIFLQEVVPSSWELFKTLSDSYELYPGDSYGYFTAMLMNKATVWVDEKTTTPFYSSVMARKLQIVHANVKGEDFKLMTSHLESTKEHTVERVRQLKMCLAEIESANKNANVLFGGDLNVRAADIKSIQFPKDVIDIWEATGSRKEAQYTWDMLRNDNTQMPSGIRPRCRFDRMYFRQSARGNVKPLHFELCGLAKVPNCSRFISDHWGIVCHLNVEV